jgi:hypothetical protein
MLAALGTMISCDAAEELCGPCGEVLHGDATISGDARLDGFFKAVGTLGNATASIEGDFKAQVAELAAVFAVDVEGLSLEDMVAEVKAEIEAEISANVDGSLSVKYEPPKCSANVSVAVDAQASCEAKAGCDVDVECTGGEVSVVCEGQCSGGCDATCSGSCSMEASGTCEGTCNGSCTMEAGGGCEGTCNGSCDGECSLQDNEGNCKGECSGTCTGSCEPPSAGMECEGECHGECKVEVEAECEGSCEGSCDAECSGGCEGTATPPSCSAEGSCEASADCQASASAEASASLECTPPSLEIDFKLDASLDANAQASFLAKMKAFKVQMIAIVQGMVKLQALVDADYAASIGIESPVVVLTGQIEAMMDVNFKDFDVPKAKIPCLIPAFQDSVEILGSVVTDTVVVVQGQISLFAIIG